MNSNNKAVWALWAIAASAVVVNIAYAFGLVVSGLDPDMDSMRYLAFSSDVANRSIANYDAVAIGYAAFTTVSNQFLHGNVMHLASNVLSLILLGYPLEKRFGAKALWLWFLSGGALGTLVQWSVTPSDTSVLIFGASGGIMTITGMYQMLYATKKIPWTKWGWCLMALSLLLLLPNLLALFGFISDAISSQAQVGVVVHLASAALGWAVGLHLSRASEESETTSAPAIGSNWKQSVGYVLLTVAITSGAAFAVGQSSVSLEERFFKYEDRDLAYKLSRDLKFATEALDKALSAPEVEAELQNVKAGVKAMDEQAQLYVYLKNNSAVGSVQEADVVRHFLDALKFSNSAANKVLKMIETEHQSFEQNLSKLQNAISGGLKMNTVELDLVVSPVMGKLGPVNKARSFLQAVQQATAAILIPISKERQVPRELEIQTIFHVVTNYLDGLASQN